MEAERPPVRRGVLSESAAKRRPAVAWLIVAAVVVGVVGAVAAGWALVGPVDDEDRVAEFCRLDERASAVRWAIYGPPFTESPEEIEALMAESEALGVDLDRVVPEEIRHLHKMLNEELADPIDALTEERGWDPFAAINTGEAIAYLRGSGHQRSHGGTLGFQAGLLLR